MIEVYFLTFLALQVLHSIEELVTGFHKKFPLMKLKFKTFLTFELAFISFWTFIFFYVPYPAKDIWMHAFILLMFANGLWHIVWFGFFERFKRYVPGLLTAPLFIIIFVVYFFHLLSFYEQIMV